MVLCGYFSAQITLGGNGNGVGSLPVSTYYEYTYSQQIFTKQEINVNAAGNITGFTFYVDVYTPLQHSADWTVYLGHTSKTTFTSTTDWVPLSQMTKTFEGIIESNGGMVKVNFPTSFPYNNIDNLVIAVHENSADYDAPEEYFKKYDTAPNSAMYIKEDYTSPNPSSPGNGYRVDYKSVITLEGLSNTLETSEIKKDKNAVKAYPNPIKDILHLSNIEKIKTIVISDTVGRLIKTIKNPDASIDVIDLKAGTYIVSLEMKDGSQQSLKMLKE